VTGPRADAFKLYQALRVDHELDVLTSMVCVGRYYPVMVDLKAVAAVKGQLAFIIHDLQMRSGEEALLIQVSVFSFNKGELIDLLAAEKSQMLFNFELSYLEEDRTSVASMTSKILSRCSKVLREKDSMNPPSIFFYVTFQVGNSQRRYKYLLGDIYNPFKASGTGFEQIVLCDELKSLLKYTSFETSEAEVMGMEETSSLDIFFNELVQERNQRMKLIVCIPTEKNRYEDAVRFANLAHKLEKTSKIFDSYTFKLVQSAVSKVPAVIARRSTQQPESRADSRATSSRKSSGFGTFDAERPALEISLKRLEERFASTFSKQQPKKASPSKENKSQIERKAPESLIEKLEVCIQEIEGRLATKDSFIEMQTDLHREEREVSKMKLATDNTLIEELDQLLEGERYQTEYLKNLIKAIAEYKWIKDEQKKAKIIQAINELGSMFGDKTITCLLNLLNGVSNAS
jgi:hypothetical protein